MSGDSARPSQQTEQIEFHRCKECGQISTSLGKLHAHAEKHRGISIGPLSIQAPWNVGDAEELEKMTETIRVTDYEVVDR